MAINTAVNNANLVNKAAQIGYAQNISAPKELKQSDEPRRVQHLDEEGLDDSGQLRDNVQQKNLEDATGAKNQRLDPVRRDTGERRQVQGTESRGASQTGKAGETTPEATSQFQSQAPQTGDVGTRTLRLALADNSRQLQAQFDSSQPTQSTQQPTMGAEARRTVMLRNLESMVNMQLAQYTGNEPYSRSNYRQILGALTQMQGGAGPATKNQDASKADSRNDQGWQAEGAEHQDGVYQLYSGQASKTLAFLSPEQEQRQQGEPFDLVA